MIYEIQKADHLQSTSYPIDEVHHDCLNLFQALHEIKGFSPQQSTCITI